MRAPGRSRTSTAPPTPALRTSIPPRKTPMRLPAAFAPRPLSFRLAPGIEAFFSRPRRSWLTSEHEALRLLLQLRSEPVEAARSACELIGKIVDTRQRLGGDRISE